ncbi:MAG: hypothetical protein HYY49_00260 [Ignavibacteriales bacterium]|nr:hypothetical protein [Ignavibacteriales bacterium]
MGTQQMLYVALGVIIVGIAIVVGVTAFQANAIESSRNALVDDLLFFATKARSYFWKPLNLGGGNNSFEGIDIRKLSARSETANGRYYIENTTSDEVVLVGVGRVVSGRDTIRVRMRVNESTSQIEIIH